MIFLMGLLESFEEGAGRSPHAMGWRGLQSDANGSAASRPTPTSACGISLRVGLMSLEEIGRQLRDECRSVRLQHADVVIGLIVGARLKRAGMRWRPHGTTALCQLRALYKSEPKILTLYWQTFAKT